MEPTIEHRIQAIEAKIDENHRLLVKIRNAQRNAVYVKALYWVIVILFGFGAWYFIKPYIGQLGEAYGVTKATTQNVDQKSVDNLLNELKNFQSN